MQSAIKKLRPKANKLLSYSANWKRANYTLNIELGVQIQTLYDKLEFPKAISLFFELPPFKKLLKNLHSGSLWKDVYIFSEEDHHPPEEIQKIQNIALAFQKLCSISHYPNYPADPLSMSKLLVEDLQDYFFILIKLKSFKGKAADKIKAHLFYSIKTFLKQLRALFKKNKALFSPISNSLYFNELKNLKQVNDQSINQTHELLSLLNIINPKDGGNVSICHKILNQMHSQTQYVFDAQEKNAPFFLPYALQKVINEGLATCLESSALHAFLENLFALSKYEIIETKQESHLQNIKEACYNIHILEKSLDCLVKKGDLPLEFTSYYNNYFLPIKAPLSQLEIYNCQVGYFLSGFYETQISYLLELLNNPFLEIKFINLKNIEDIIVSFLETYVKIKPELLQVDIKTAFTNIYIKEQPLNEAKAYIKALVSIILPKKNEDVFTLLEKESKKILTSLLSIYKAMDSKSFPAILLKEKIKGLYLLDIPSFQLGLHLFGEIISTLYILSSFSGQDGDKIIEPFLCNIYKYPIFSILLNTKTSNLPKILIKLQMI